MYINNMSKKALRPEIKLFFLLKTIKGCNFLKTHYRNHII